MVILAWDTNQLFSAGFQFSFAIVFVVIWLTERVQRRLLPFGQPDPFLPRQLWRWPEKARASAWCRWLTANFSVSVASFVGSILFTAGYFHLFSPNSVLANLAAVPLAFAVLALGLASLAASAALPVLGLIFNNANYCCATALYEVLRFFAAAPGGFIYVGHPRLPPTPACELTVLDLGNGGATHLRGRTEPDWLIDCGQGYEYDHVVLPYLRLHGVNSLDGLALTHGSAPHIGAALSVLNDFHPPVVVDSGLKDRSSARRHIHTTLEDRQTGKRIVTRGDVIEISPRARLRVLYPPAGLERPRRTTKALVLLLEAGGEERFSLRTAGSQPRVAFA